MTEVSVVIVCMNRLDNLYPCLESLREHTRCSYEVLVVAYLFSAPNLERAKRDFPWVRFIESNEVRGFSENNNLALAQARGRYCFILNDDTLFTTDTISQLLRDFALLPPSAAIITPRLLNSDGSLQLCGRPPYPPINYLLQQWHLYREPKDDTLGKTPLALNNEVSESAASSSNAQSRGSAASSGTTSGEPDPKSSDSSSSPAGHTAPRSNAQSEPGIRPARTEAPAIYPTSNICGAAFLIKTTIFQELGWFDERYFFTPEDIALSTLARQRGYGVYVDKSATIIHKARTTATPISAAVRPASIRGSLIFFSRGSKLRYLLLASGVFAAEAIKYLKSALLNLISPSDRRALSKRVYRANCAAIFTRLSPKEIFIARRSSEQPS